MYLSRFELNPARRGAKRLISSPQSMHAAVLSAFPHGGGGVDHRVLWRLDTGPDRRAELLVVSPDRPDFTHLVEQAGWPTTQTWQTTDYQPFLSGISAGGSYRFRLRANPVRSVKREGDGRGRVVSCGARANQEAWLLERCGALGFEVLASDRDPQGGPPVNLATTARGTLRFSKGHGRSPRVTLAYAQFDGILRVLDADLLRAALVRGVGRGKAYGLGLLTVARA